MHPRDADPVDRPLDRDDPGVPLGSSFVPVLSGVLEAADDLTCRRAVRVELAELPLPALRRRRALLQEEVRRVQHWHRLVRARRDLLVATACGPEELQVPVEAASHGGPLDQHLDHPGHPLEQHLERRIDLDAGTGRSLDPARGLRGLLLLDRPIRGGGLPDQLQELSGAQQRLAGYEDALLAELAVATDVLAERCRALFRPAGA
ncbi:hypothetical protein [Kineococcus aurantiacus]|uniref:Uncharacterized protein n=1 Tax=Kineococcus aurantiacus TaxID=37633 RepID=A0A7Y9DKJ4_9ACTN|nr:hypothetical protein [Kineococcus aurantiacus]NYD22273.1 hypothetical protein [Kineococcus aurantiacus]